MIIYGLLNVLIKNDNDSVDKVFIFVHGLIADSQGGRVKRFIDCAL